MIRRRWLVNDGGSGDMRGVGKRNALAQDATPADKEKALAVLETSKKGVLGATKGLSQAQWNFKAAPDKWSVAECMEHIAAAEDFIRGMVAENVMKAAAAPDRDIAKIDAGILAMVPDRTNKVQAPDPPEADQPVRFAARLAQAFCGKPRNHTRIPQENAGIERARGRQSRGREVGRVRVYSVDRSAQRTPH
jgi:hypothetical protein